MSAPYKYLLSLSIFFICFSTTHAQNNQWLLGEWKGIGIIPGSDYSTVFVRTLNIKIEAKNRFAGLLVQELMNNKSIRIEKEISGNISNDEIKIVTGRTLYKKE